MVSVVKKYLEYMYLLEGISFLNHLSPKICQKYVKRFKTRQQAENFVQTVISLGQPLLTHPRLPPSPLKIWHSNGLGDRRVGSESLPWSGCHDCESLGSRCIDPDGQGMGWRHEAHQQRRKLSAFYHSRFSRTPSSTEHNATLVYLIILHLLICCNKK